MAVINFSKVINKHGVYACGEILLNGIHPVDGMPARHVMVGGAARSVVLSFIKSGLWGE